MMTEEKINKETVSHEEEIFKNTIYRVVHGSRAYGTHRPDSDRDEKGVCILPDPRYYFGTKHFEQKDKGWSDGNDRVIFDIRKFFSLALNCNPNIIEILFVDDSDVIHIDNLGKKLRDNRNIFLSRRAAQTFVGYAKDQLYKIKNHKKWHDSAIIEPKEEDFWYKLSLSYKDAVFQREFEGHLFVVHPPKPVDPPENLKSILNMFDAKMSSNSKLEPPSIEIEHFDKAAFVAAKKKYKQYVDWKKNRNPERAALEKKFNFDLKNACQLVRLLRMGMEIITEGKVLVKRPDAQELLAIRNGEKYTYDELISYTEDLVLNIKELTKQSPLPAEPDYEAAEKLLLELIQERLDSNGH